MTRSVQEILDERTAQLRAALGRDDVTVALITEPILLSPEKPEKKWPDDFRGFGSNVAPKKRRRKP